MSRLKRPPRVSFCSEIEGNEVSVGGDEFDRLCFPGGGVAAHAGGVGRHAPQSESRGVGALVEELHNRAGGNVTFDDIAIHEGGVARRGTLRNAVLGFECGQLLILCEVDAGSEFLQVPDPP